MSDVIRTYTAILLAIMLSGLLLVRKLHDNGLASLKVGLVGGVGNSRFSQPLL